MQFEVAVNVLSRLELLELAALEQQLECLPDERSSGLGRVDSIITNGESGANGLVNVDD